MSNSFQLLENALNPHFSKGIKLGHNSQKVQNERGHPKNILSRTNGAKNLLFNESPRRKCKIFLSRMTKLNKEAKISVANLIIELFANNFHHESIKIPINLKNFTVIQVLREINFRK